MPLGFPGFWAAGLLLPELFLLANGVCASGRFCSVLVEVFGVALAFPLCQIRILQSCLLVRVMKGFSEQRSSARHFIRGGTAALLTDLLGRFPSVSVDLVDLSDGGIGCLLPPDLNVSAGDRFELQFRSRDGEILARRVTLRWAAPNELLVSAGFSFDWLIC